MGTLIYHLREAISEVANIIFGILLYGFLSKSQLQQKILKKLVWATFEKLP